MSKELFRTLVDAELDKHKLSNKCCKSWHEAYGLIAEEVEEFWDEVKKKSAKRDKVNALVELVQISALCERIASDLALLEDYKKALNNVATY